MGHVGVERTLNLIQGRLYWPRIYSDTLTFFHSRVWVSQCKAPSHSDQGSPDDRCHYTPWWISMHWLFISLCLPKPMLRKTSLPKLLLTNYLMTLHCEWDILRESTTTWAESLTTSWWTNYKRAVMCRGLTPPVTIPKVMENVSGSIGQFYQWSTPSQVNKRPSGRTHWPKWCTRTTAHTVGSQGSPLTTYFTPEEGGKSCVLHRNLQLPCDSLSLENLEPDPTKQARKILTRTRTTHKINKPVEDSDNENS